MIKNDIVRSACCVAVFLCCCASAMVENGTANVNHVDSTQAVAGQPPELKARYASDWYTRRLSRVDLTLEGYKALQKDYNYDECSFEETKRAFEKILTDIKQGTFKTPGEQLVLDYVHYWYYISCEQRYPMVKTGLKNAEGRCIWRALEYEIRDIAAQILDELLHTGGLAYSTLHYCDRK